MRYFFESIRTRAYWKKIIERIAQSFTDACNQRAFSNKLIIVVRPEDASKFSLNLFQVRDYLGQSLHT
jgi:hypothetical protein